MSLLEKKNKTAQTIEAPSQDQIPKQDVKNKIYFNDVFEVVSQLPKNSVQLIICDGPYGVTSKTWDKIENIQQYNLKLIQLFSRVLKPGGSLFLFGKHNAIDFIDYRPYLNLNSRIIWYQPNRLAQGRKSFTNNYDIIAYFSKGKPLVFHLDDIRVPQLVELEHRLRIEKVPSVTQGKYGKTKFNPKGKNPGDVWGDIKQLTYRSKELLDRSYLNTIQKPQALMKRLVLSSSSVGDIVLEPFAGTGSASLVAKDLNRNFIAIENDAEMISALKRRLQVSSIS